MTRKQKIFNGFRSLLSVFLVVSLLSLSSCVTTVDVYVRKGGFDGHYYGGLVGNGGSFSVEVASVQDEMGLTGLMETAADDFVDTGNPSLDSRPIKEMFPDIELPPMPPETLPIPTPDPLRNYDNFDVERGLGDVISNLGNGESAPYQAGVNPISDFVSNVFEAMGGIDNAMNMTDSFIDDLNQASSDDQEAIDDMQVYIDIGVGVMFVISTAAEIFVFGIGVKDDVYFGATDMFCYVLGGCARGPEYQVIYLTKTDPLILRRDPSGFIYSIAEENRIIGATATLYQLVDFEGNPIVTPPPEGTAEIDENAPDGAGYHWVVWEDILGEWLNPQLTTTDGRYRWDTPPGWWRVKISKSGYQTTCSQGTTGENCQDLATTESGRDVYVPPEELNLDFGLIDIGPPTFSGIDPLESIKLISTGTTLTFSTSEKMTPATTTTSNITLTGPSGAEDITITESTDPETYTYTYTVEPTSTLTQYEDYSLNINNLQDYAGNILASQSFTHAVEDPYPYVVSSTPENYSSDFSISGDIILNLNKSINTSTINYSSLSLYPTNDTGSIVNSTITFDSNSYPNDKIIISPSQDLDNSTNYSVVLGSGALDTSGNQLNRGSNYRIYFNTESGSSVLDYTSSGSEVTFSRSSSGEITLPDNKDQIHFNSNQHLDFLSGTTQFSSGATTLRSVILKSGILGQRFKISSTDNINIELDDSTKIHSDQDWDGTFLPPRDIKSTSSLAGHITREAQRVGHLNKTLYLDKPAKITLTSSTGSPYYRFTSSSPWNEITTICNSSTNPTNLTSPNECYYKDTNTNTTIIWTYHLTDYGVFDPQSNSIDTLTKLQITPGEVTINAPTLLDFGTGSVSSSTQSVTVDLLTHSGGSLYFDIQDLKGSTSGYYATLDIGNLTVSGTSKQIDNDNVYITLTGDNSSLTKLDGLYNQDTPPEILIPFSTPITHIPINLPLTVLEREYPTTPDEGILGRYGIQPKFDIDIPKYQEIGSYDAVMTYTLYEN